MMLVSRDTLRIVPCFVFTTVGAKRVPLAHSTPQFWHHRMGKRAVSTIETEENFRLLRQLSIFVCQRGYLQSASLLA